VSTPGFLFALQLSGEPPFDEQMLGEVAARVLGSVGYGEDMAREVAAFMRGALAEGTAGGSKACEVQFAVEGRDLHVVVTCGGGGQWRTSYPLAKI
jgi:hypothetical protein